MSFLKIDGSAHAHNGCGVHFPRAPEIQKEDKTQKTAQSSFPKLNFVQSLKLKGRANLYQQRAFNLATFLAAYPIVKLALAIIAKLTVGVAISLPPVAFGLLIAATTLFLITLILKMITMRSRPTKQLIKIFFREVAKFAVAPVTSLYIIGKGIQHQIEARQKQRSKVKVN